MNPRLFRRAATFLGLALAPVLSAMPDVSSGYRTERREYVGDSMQSFRPEIFPPTPAPEASGWNPKNPGYTVIVDVTLNEQGRSESTAIHASDDPSNDQILNTVALKLAADFKQEPKKKSAQPVKSIARVPFFFPVDRDEGPDTNRAPRPRLISGAPIAFPAALAGSHENGGAVVELRIGAGGTVQRVDVLDASHPAYGEAVRTAAETWRFDPAKQDGLAVPSRWRIAVEFNVDGIPGEYKWRVAPRPNLGSYIVRLPPVR